MVVKYRFRTNLVTWWSTFGFVDLELGFSLGPSRFIKFEYWKTGLSSELGSERMGSGLCRYPSHNPDHDRVNKNLPVKTR